MLFAQELTTSQIGLTLNVPDQIGLLLIGLELSFHEELIGLKLGGHVGLIG